MASKASLWSQLAAAIKISDEIFKFAAINATNFVGLVDTLAALYEGNHIAETASKVDSLHNNLVSIVSYVPFDSILFELASIYGGKKANSIHEAIEAIIAGMVAASETVKNRAWTYGEASYGGTNTGNGLAIRITKDKNNQNIEVGHYAGGTIKGLVSSDKNIGAVSGNETISLYGNGISQIDAIKYKENTVETLEINAKNSSNGLLQNANFSSYTGTGLTDIVFTSWTLADSTKANVETTTVFRDGATLIFADNNAITQYLPDIVGAIDINVPVIVLIRYMRKTSCDGTLTLRLGSKTSTVSVSSKNNDEWNYLAVGIDSGDGFYDNFKEDSSGNGARISIALTSRTTGTLYIGECVMIQPEKFDGKYYVVIAGNTDFIKGDYFTFTDSVSNTGRIQTTMTRLYGAYLPHAASGETYGDA